MDDNWQVLNLNYPGLEKVKDYLKKDDEEAAYQSLEEYFFQRNKNGFLRGKEEISNSIRKFFGKERLKYANCLLDKTFLFNKPWDMEKCLVPVTFPQKIDWEYVFDNDQEWTYMLNRQNYLLDLVLSYIKTEDYKYLEGYEFLVGDWLQQEPNYVGKEDTSWRTIDTGIRLKNWVKQMEFLFLTRRVSGGFLLKMLGGISRQLHYLVDVSAIDVYKMMTNWRILESHGSFIASVFFPELKNSQHYQEESQKNLEECLPLQITDSGFHWEQAFMYHHEVFLAGLEAYQIANNNHLKFSKKYKDTLNKMLKASTHLIAPNYKQITYGDTDKEDMRTIVTLGAILLQPRELNLKGIEKKISFETILNFGDESEQVYQNFLKRVKKENTLDFHHPDVGLTFIRNNWSQKGNYLFFKNGYLGSGHGHNDLLSFVLFMNGEEIFTDPGRFTYSPQKEERQLFKESRMHNTMTVDGKEYTLQKGSWGNTKVANEIKRTPLLTKKYSFLQGMHMGYGPNIVLNRKIICFKEENLYIFSDECYTDEEHVLEQHFHFNHSKVRKGKNKIIYNSRNNQVALQPLDGQSISIKKEDISKEYNQLEETQMVTLKSAIHENSYLNFCIFDSDKNPVRIKKVPVYDRNKQMVSEKSVSAYEIKTVNNHYLLTMTHFEPENMRRMMYVVNGLPVFGKTVVTEIKETSYENHVLEY